MYWKKMNKKAASYVIIAVLSVALITVLALIPSITAIPKNITINEKNYIKFKLFNKNKQIKNKNKKWIKKS